MTIFNLEYLLLYMNNIQIQLNMNTQKLQSSYRISDVMVSVLASSAVDRGLESRSGQTKDYKIGICCFSANHTILG
jgi:hypothetical protein